MNGKNPYPDEGQESGGQSGLGRRAFLGAAAALATLPAAGAVAAEGESIDAQGETVAADGGPADGPVHTVGGVEIPTDWNWDTAVGVTTFNEGVKLALRVDMATMDVLLLPEDVDALCAKLQQAKQGLDDEYVAEAREWITEKHKPDGEGGA